MTRTVLLAALFALVSLAAEAQTDPNRAVRMIVPFAPGGQQEVVENRPGGGTSALSSGCFCLLEPHPT